MVDLMQEKPSSRCMDAICCHPLCRPPAAAACSAVSYVHFLWSKPLHEIMSQSSRGIKMDPSLHWGFYGSVGWRSSSLLHLVLMLEEEIWPQGSVCPPAVVLQVLVGLHGCICVIGLAKNKQEVFMNTAKWCITCADEVSIADSSEACLHLKPWKHYYVFNFSLWDMSHVVLQEVFEGTFKLTVAALSCKCW